MSEKSKYPSFVPDKDESAEILLKWWKGLEEAHRGDRARLRRVASPLEALFEPSVNWLIADLRHNGFKVIPEQIAAVAALSAMVKENIRAEKNGINKSLSYQMALPKEGSKNARVSGLRFRRLLKASEGEELFTMLQRVLRLMGSRADILAVAQSVCSWQEWMKKQWALDYYETAPKDEKYTINKETIQ